MSDEVKLTWGKTENDLLQRWPKSADGTPEEPALLTVAMDTNAETDMLCAMLRSYDIPVLRKYEGEGSFGKIVLGMPGSGTWLYVPSSMLEDAKNLIRPIDEIPEQEDDVRWPSQHEPPRHPLGDAGLCQRHPR